MSDPELPVARMEETHLYTPQFPVELWQEVFLTASSIPGKDELSTDTRAHNHVPLVPGMRSAKIKEKELEAALKVRWSTVLVCKQWYNIGIALLYQHITINRHLEDCGLDFALAGDCARHMHHTMRMTIPSQLRFEGTPPLYIRPSEVLARICKNLPNLQILNAPSELLPQFQREGIFPLLKIAECTGYRTSMPALSVRSNFRNIWTNLQFLYFPTDFMSPSLDNDVVVFPSVQHLFIVNSVYGEGCVHSAAYISRYWLLPQLRTFSATLMTWQSICRFCERHATTLRVVILHCTEGSQYTSPLPLHTTPSSLPLPRLEELYCDDIRFIRFSPLKHVRTVGVHSLGPQNLWEYASWRWDPKPFQERLMIALELWNNHPRVFKCFISGVDYALDWFKTQPAVVEALGLLAAKGSVVEFLPTIPKFV